MMSIAASTQDDVLSTICQCVSEIEDLKHLELACSRLREIGGFHDSKKKFVSMICRCIPIESTVCDQCSGLLRLLGTVAVQKVFDS